jgi:hypothetical protein
MYEDGSIINGILERNNANGKFTVKTDDSMWGEAIKTIRLQTVADKPFYDIKD